MKINKFSKYIFWSYKPDANLPESLITEKVILYGEVKDMILLTKLVDKKVIRLILDKISKAKSSKKRINFFKKVIL